MKIAILGTGCAKCRHTADVVRQAVEQTEADATIERVRSQTLRTKPRRSRPSTTPSRLSTSRKSFPLPLSFEKGMPFFMGSSVSIG